MLLTGKRRHCCAGSIRSEELLLSDAFIPVAEGPSFRHPEIAETMSGVIEEQLEAILFWATGLCLTLAPSGVVPELLGDLAQKLAPSGSCYAPSRQVGKLLLQLRADEGAVQLLGRNRRRPRAREGIEDQLALTRGGEQGTPDEPQGLLGWVAAVKFLDPGAVGMRQTEETWEAGFGLFTRS